MEAYVLDWANLLLRWLHVITAIAWIGSSFYFVFLDNNLLKPKSPDLLEKGADKSDVKAAVGARTKADPVAAEAAAKPARARKPKAEAAAEDAN